jgi:hypothetical protein
MKQIVTLLSVVIISTAIFAQTPQSIVSDDLIITVNKPSVTKQVTKNAAYLTINRQLLSETYNGLHNLDRIPNFPMPDGTFRTLQVEQFDVLTKNAQIVEGTASGNKPIMLKPYILLRGTVEGESESHVMLSVFEDMCFGYLTIGTEQILIAPSKNGNVSVVYYRNEIPAELETTPWNCKTEEWAPNQAAIQRFPQELARMNSIQVPQAKNVKLIKLGIDCDYEYYKIYQQSLDSSTKYAIAVLGAMSDIMIRDLNTAVKATFLRVWTTEDPYPGTKTSELLPQFQDYWNGNMGFVDRAVGILFSGHQDGGLASLDVLCDANGYGNAYNVSGLNGYAPYPTDKYVWDSDVTCHELGHNIGSVHTHNCGWAPPIDSCVAAEGNCYSGTKPRLGTIMSYCHLTTSQGGGTELKYHPRVITYLKQKINAASCVISVPAPEVNVTSNQLVCIGTPVPLSAAITGGTEPYQILWFPKTGLDSTTTPHVIATPFRNTMYVCRITDENNVRAFDTVWVRFDTVDVYGGPDLRLCGVDSVQLTATVNKALGKYTYEWRDTANPLMLLSNQQKIWVSGKKTAGYRITVTDSLGCKGSDVVFVSSAIKAGLKITTSTSDTLLCTDSAVVLYAGKGYSSYKWSTGAATDSILVTNPGLYTCIVTSLETGCTDTGSIRMVNGPRPPKPTITFKDNILTCDSVAAAYQWYRNNIRLSAGTDRVYIPPANGNYKVRITDSAGCTNTSDVLSVTLGVEEPVDILSAVQLFPNPASEHITLRTSLNPNAITNLSVTDITGRTIWQAVRMQTAEIQIDLSQWSSGPYILHYSLNAEHAALKFVKE